MLEYITLDISFDLELKAFREGGAEGVGITEFTGPKGRDIDRMKTTLEDQDIAVTVCWPEIPSILPLDGFAGDRDPVARRDRFISCIRRLSTLDPIGIACLTGAQGSYSRAKARAMVVDGLRAAADVAAECDIRLGIEPIHASIAEGLSLVSTISETADLIAECDSPNLGIMFDIWHSWDSPQLRAEIRECVDDFLLVHVCDWREPTRSWADRVLPGDGVADVPGILGQLEAAGYRGWYELEVISDNGVWGNSFPDSLWHHNPRELVSRGKAAFDRCWSARYVDRPDVVEPARMVVTADD
jgi:sugar phosphate isomerase/epimerase